MKLTPVLIGLLTIILSLSFKKNSKTNAPPPTQTSSIDTGLLAHYTFVGNTQDISGNGYHLTSFGPTPSADRFGISASAYKFNGKTDYMTIPALLKAESVRQFSIAVWVKPTEITYNSILSLLSIISNSCSSSISISHEGSSFIIRNKVIFFDSPNNCTVGIGSGATADLTGNWHHLVLVQTYISGPNETNPRYNYDLYYDGRKFSLGSSGIGSNPKAISLVKGGIIGGNNNSGNYAANFEMFTGDIDDIRIYKRALTSAEITEIYNLKK